MSETAASSVSRVSFTQLCEFIGTALHKLGLPETDAATAFGDDVLVFHGRTYFWQERQ